MFDSIFANSRFRVLIYPDSAQSEMSGKAIIPYLRERGIEYLDFTSILDMRQAGFTIKGDDHPSTAAHKRVAEVLVKELHLAD